MSQNPLQLRRADDVAPQTRRGGEIRTLLSPGNAGATSGFMGIATIAPGDWIAEHYHPYSEEFIYVVAGEITVWVDGAATRVASREAVLIPIGARHRVTNDETREASLVFHLGPLAPRPDLGHVETEARDAGAAAAWRGA
jgi:putative monooxygenase